jgi:hypothetical protein
MNDFDKIISKQQVRLLDVFVVAPFLIYTSTLKGVPSKRIRLSLLVLGVATLVYNGSNYLKEAKNV